MAILGNNSTSSSSYWDLNKNGAYYEHGLYKVTATETGTVQSIVARVNPRGQTTRPYGAIYDSSKNKITNGSANAVTAFNGSFDFYWHTITFPTEPTIISGQSYYLAFAHDSIASVRLNYDGTGANGGYIVPTALIPSSFGTINSSQLFCIYINYTVAPTGPSYLVEGITPASFIGTDWADIEDIG